ncbi:MAG: SNF2-related protein, partial [Bradymonadaceae bacterium]
MSKPTTARWVRQTLEQVEPPDSCSRNSFDSVGDLDLAPFQSRAVERALDIARRYGGVLLADSVGLGKTRVALATARWLAREDRLSKGARTPVWFCVPAKLRDQWRRSAERAGLDRYRVASHAELSRGLRDVDRAAPAAVIADEAHRFRNPRTNRHSALASLCRNAPVVLATATPICNSTFDLYHLLGLFLAECDLRPVVGRDLKEAFELAEDGEFDLTDVVRRVTIRRTEPPSDGEFGEIPNVDLDLLEYRADSDEQWIWQNLESALRATDFVACRNQ